MRRALLPALLLAFSHTLLAAGAVHEYRLANGLKLIVKEDHRAPVVVSQVWYKVGSSYEHDGITGLSHMLEHMMFQGTKNHAPGEFSRIISENGGEENAFTSQDYTAYYPAAGKRPAAGKLRAGSRSHAQPVAAATGIRQGAEGGDGGTTPAHRRPAHFAHLRTVRRRRFHHQFLPLSDHRLDERSGKHATGGSGGLVSTLVRTEQCGACGGRGCGSGRSAEAGAQILRAPQTGNYHPAQTPHRTETGGPAPDHSRGAGRSAVSADRLQGTFSQDRQAGLGTVCA